MTDFLFEGFEPTPEIKSIAKELLWSLENQAPSQARPSAFLKRNESGHFLGNISFTSRKVTLSAEVTDANPEAVLDKLKFQLKDDIRKWRETRFQTA